jgi:hypothetical protein
MRARRTVAAMDDRIEADRKIVRVAVPAEGRRVVDEHGVEAARPPRGVVHLVRLVYQPHRGIDRLETVAPLRRKAPAVDDEQQVGPKAIDLLGEQWIVPRRLLVHQPEVLRRVAQSVGEDVATREEVIVDDE